MFWVVARVFGVIARVMCVRFVVSRSLGCSVVARVFGVVAGMLYVVARAGILKFG